VASAAVVEGPRQTGLCRPSAQVSTKPGELPQLSAHEIVRGSRGSMTADFEFRGMNNDGTKVNGAIILVLQPPPEPG
jgi:hypothetical protein